MEPCSTFTFKAAYLHTQSCKAHYGTLFYTHIPSHLLLGPLWNPVLHTFKAAYLHTQSCKAHYGTLFYTHIPSHLLLGPLQNPVLHPHTFTPLVRPPTEPCSTSTFKAAHCVYTFMLAIVGHHRTFIQIWNKNLDLYVQK